MQIGEGICTKGAGQRVFTFHGLHHGVAEQRYREKKRIMYLKKWNADVFVLECVIRIKSLRLKKLSEEDNMPRLL